MTHVRQRFWSEAFAGGVCWLLFISTLAWPDWIEIIFGVDPDQGSGLLEWVIVVLSAAAAITCSALARVEWRRSGCNVAGAGGS